jgi:cytochrome c-type biogenesis protein CcmE
MTRLYVQWTVVVVAAAIVSVAAFRYHDRHLVTFTPEAVADGAAGPDVVRVQGLVAGGTLMGDPSSGQAAFRLGGDRDAVQVEYNGPPPENLRELKTLVVIGRWDAERRVFAAHDFALIPNYGFIVSAYLVALLPLALFIFLMERRVRLLYAEIKQAKLYEPELPAHVDSR